MWEFPGRKFFRSIMLYIIPCMSLKRATLSYAMHSEPAALRYLQICAFGREIFTWTWHSLSFAFGSRLSAGELMWTHFGCLRRGDVFCATKRTILCVFWLESFDSRRLDFGVWLVARRISSRLGHLELNESLSLLISRWTLELGLIKMQQ